MNILNTILRDSVELDILIMVIHLLAHQFFVKTSSSCLPRLFTSLPLSALLRGQRRCERHSCTKFHILSCIRPSRKNASIMAVYERQDI